MMPPGPLAPSPQAPVAAQSDPFATAPPASWPYEAAGSQVGATEPWASLTGSIAPLPDTAHLAPSQTAIPVPQFEAAPPQTHAQPAQYTPAHGVSHTPWHGRTSAYAAPDRRSETMHPGTRRPARRRTWLIAVFATLILVAGAAAAYYVLTRSDSAPSSTQAAPTDPGPTGTVSRFLTAVQKRDYDAAAAEVCAQTGITPAQLGAVFDQQFSGGIDGFVVEPTPATANATTPTLVKYTLTVNGQSSSYQASVASSDAKACITENRHLG